jgi:hypothetical protein
MLPTNFAEEAKCLRKGVNGIGIPDLMVAQNAKQNLCEIYSFFLRFSPGAIALFSSMTGTCRITSGTCGNPT